MPEPEHWKKGAVLCFFMFALVILWDVLVIYYCAR